MQTFKIKDLLNQRRDVLLNETIYTGNARVNLPGDLNSNIKRHVEHLKNQGHEIIKNEPHSDAAIDHEMISKKDGKIFHHTLKPHGDGKWTTIETKVQ